MYVRDAMSSDAPSPEAVQKIPEKEIANKNEEKMKELMTTIKSLERALSSSLNLQTKLKRTSLETQKKLVTAERELQEQKKENATMKENKSLSTEKNLPDAVHMRDRRTYTRVTDSDVCIEADSREALTAQRC